MIETRLPAELVGLICKAAAEAEEKGYRLYLVGGVVRDLLLEKVSFDIDLAVEGDAIGLARSLSGVTGGKLLVHERFNTAKIKSDKWVMDIATCRSETYARPGALPTIRPGSLRDDMARRDFTINAMAVRLNPAVFGELVDPYGGLNDLKQRFIRILHDNSFTYDATRIWRAVRYEQRLDFNIEAHTLGLLKRDIDRLETISGDRIRHEMELVLSEHQPEKRLHRAYELGVLQKVHSSLKGDAWLVQKYQRAREILSSEQLNASLNWGILVCRLQEAEVVQLISYLKLPRPITDVARDSVRVRLVLEKLKNNRLKQSRIYALLSAFSPAAVKVNEIVTEDETLRNKLDLYLNTLRNVKPALNGKDLAVLGIAAGPRMQEILDILRDARLDGEVEGRAQEKALVERWLLKSNAGGGD